MLPDAPPPQPLARRAPNPAPGSRCPRPQLLTTPPSGRSGRPAPQSSRALKNPGLGRLACLRRRAEVCVVRDGSDARRGRLLRGGGSGWRRRRDAVRGRCPWRWWQRTLSASRSSWSSARPRSLRYRGAGEGGVGGARCWDGPGGAGGLAEAPCVPARLRDSVPLRSAAGCGHKRFWRWGLEATVTSVPVSADFCLKVLFWESNLILQGAVLVALCLRLCLWGFSV